MVDKKTKMKRGQIKKAQMKIQQMAFMLLAVTIFFVMVGMVFLVVRFSNLKEDATGLCEKNAQLLSTKLANSPEFSCGEAFGSSKVNCVDADKVMMLKENIAKYSNFWGVNNIVIRKIYPDEGEEECKISNYPNCSIIKIRSVEETSEYLSNYVSLCRKEAFEGTYYNKCELAKIMISYEYGEKC